MMARKAGLMRGIFACSALQDGQSMRNRFGCEFTACPAFRLVEWIRGQPTVFSATRTDEYQDENCRQQSIHLKTAHGTHLTRTHRRRQRRPGACGSYHQLRFREMTAVPNPVVRMQSSNDNCIPPLYCRFPGLVQCSCFPLGQLRGNVQIRSDILLPNAMGSDHFPREQAWLQSHCSAPGS